MLFSAQIDWTRSSNRRQHTSVHMSQLEFLGNTANKVHFIALPTSHLEVAGCEVHHASAVADRLIVLAALDVADTCAAYEKTHTFSSC